MAKEKTLFKSAYNFGGSERTNTPTGSPIQDEYNYKINAFGQKVLEKTGETNLYEKIQANLEETKIENIMARVTMGDTSMLRPDGIYADLTTMPSNLLEARQAMQELENTWNGLPAEIRKKYNNDLDQYIGASGTEEWLRDMGLLNEKTIEAVAEAVEEKAVEVKGVTNE